MAALSPIRQCAMTVLPGSSLCTSGTGTRLTHCRSKTRHYTRVARHRATSLPGLPCFASWDAAVMSASALGTEDVLHEPPRPQLDVFLDEHRRELGNCLSGMTEEQARRSLLPSRTTLLGLVKHVTFVECVWFGEAVTGGARSDLGIASTPDESFLLDPEDSIDGVLSAYATACEASRLAVASLSLDELLLGNRRGPVPLRWVYLHMLRELAQHCGQADILREQILSNSVGAPIA